MKKILLAKRVKVLGFLREIYALNVREKAGKGVPACCLGQKERDVVSELIAMKLWLHLGTKNIDCRQKQGDPRICFAGKGMTLEDEECKADCIAVPLSDSKLELYAICPESVPNDKYGTVLECIAYANAFWDQGQLVLDMQSGKIAYRQTIKANGKDNKLNWKELISANVSQMILIWSLVKRVLDGEEIKNIVSQFLNSRAGDNGWADKLRFAYWNPDWRFEETMLGLITERT